MIIKKTVFIVVFSLTVATTIAQTLTIEQCYEMARKNYPLIRQKELLVKSMEFTISNARSGYLPQVTIYGSATYQSDVTRLPSANIPGVSPLIEPLAKDQYRIYGELNQSIYDGGVILYKIYDRINQIYFGVLLMDAQTAQVNLLKADLRTSLAKAEASIKNGTAFKSNGEMIEAEILKSDQRLIEMRATRKGFLDMLGYFINTPLSDNVVLEKPIDIAFESTPEIRRPEMKLYQFQTDLLSAQYKSSITRNVPKLGFFVQAGYGRPGLNVLKNEFDTYYLGGFRLNWALSGFYNSHRDRQLLDINSQVVNSQKDAFVFNTNLTLTQQGLEVKKLNDLIAVDNDIIALRVRISNTSKAQHENGVISTSDLLRELNAEDASKQNLLVHQVQLMLAQYNYQTTIGK